jgi:hypothetical protein
MQKRNRYSKWEYEEKKSEEQEIEDSIKAERQEEESEKSSEEENEQEEDGSEKKESSGEVSDDTEVDVNGVKMTLSELKNGYMRHDDYTRKTQEIAKMSKEDKSKVEEKAQEVIDNKDEFDPKDVAAAEYLMRILKKNHGVMTRAEFEAEENQKKQVADIKTAIRTANEFVESLRKTQAGNSLPKFDEDSVIAHMRETGIHDFKAAWKDMNEAQWIDYNIKLAKGSKSYKSEKNGERIEMKKKEFNVRNPEDARNAILDDIKSYKSE